MHPKPNAEWSRWLWPRPRGLAPKGGSLPITAETRLVVMPESGPLTRRGAALLQADLKAHRGFALPVAAPSEAGAGPLIAVGHSAQNAALQGLLAGMPGPTPLEQSLTASAGYTLTRVEPPAEGYLLRCEPERCVVAGADDAGCLYGIQSLRQVLRGTGGAHIPAARIWDWPCFPVRAMHCFCPRRSTLAKTEQMIEALALWKMNTLVLSFEYVPNFPFEGYPGLVDERETLSRAEHAAFASRCRALGFQVVPLVPSFSHMHGFLVEGSGLDDMLEQTGIPRSEARTCFRPRGNTCPSHPRTYEVFFDLFDQVLDAYPSRLLHIGHDEIDDGPLGLCDRCKGIPYWQLLAEDVWRIYDRLTLRRGVRLMMWPDVLIPWFRGGPRDGQNSNKRSVVPPHLFLHFAAEHLPKDIIMTNWEYLGRDYYLDAGEAPEGRYPSLDYLLARGYSVLPFGYHDPRAIMLYAQAAWRRCRLEWALPGEGGPDRVLAECREGVLGYAGCTWGQWSPPEAGRKPSTLFAAGHAATAACAWNPHQIMAATHADSFHYLRDTMDWLSAGPAAREAGH